MCLRISYRFIEIFLGSVQVVFHNHFVFLPRFLRFFPFCRLFIIFYYPLFFFSLLFFSLLQTFIISVSLDQVDLFTARPCLSPPFLLRQSGSKDEVFLVNFFSIRLLLFVDTYVLYVVRAEYAFKWTRPARPSLSRFCPISIVLIRR